MPLGAGWWGGTWTAARWLQNWVGATVVTNLGAVFDTVTISLIPGRLCQGDFSEIYGGGPASSYGTNNFNLGRIWMVDDATAAVHEFRSGMNGVTVLVPTPAMTAALRVLAYRTGGYPRYESLFMGPNGTLALTYLNTVPTSSVWHYQPYCYYGTPAEVIAAILLHLGLTTTYIDTAAFDQCYDDQNGAAYGANATDRPYVYVRREIGETVADTIKRVARHSWDLLGVRMNGKVAMMSRVNASTATLLGGIVGDVAWHPLLDNLVNYAVAKHGQFMCKWVGGGDQDNQVEWDPNLRNDVQGRLTKTYQQTTSQGRFGLRALTAGGAEKVQDGLIEKVDKYHLPYFNEETRKDTLLNHVDGREAEWRWQLTIKQTLLGLDYDLGYAVNCAGVIDDAPATLTDMLCVEKEIDFANLTVESILMEQTTGEYTE